MNNKDMTPSIETIEENDPKDPSLRAAVRDGVSHAVMMGAGETYLGPFGIFLRASTVQVGILATLPQFFGSIMQLAGARAMPRFRSRRTVVLTGVLVQAVLWIPMAILPFLFGYGMLPVFLLIGLVTLYHGANGSVVPVWNSLIGDLVPAKIRGRFFGSRNRLTGMSTFMALLLAGVILHYFEKERMAEVGYLIIFSVAFLARLNSARWIARYEDPEIRILPEESFTFRQFLRRSPYSNFAKFVFFIGAINLGVSFSAPYFTLYMLRDLKFSYLEFTVVTAVATISQFFTFRYWGELSDPFGNKKILNICGWGVAIVPALWLVSHHIGYLVLIQIYSGFVWAGFNLASVNFIFDAVTPPKRALCVAYQGLVNGLCVFVGSLAGGYVATQLPEFYPLGSWVWKPISPLPVIFLLSGVMRLVASGLLLHRFKEVRQVEPIRGHEIILRISHLKPIAGATFSLFTGRSRDHKNDVSGKDHDQGHVGVSKNRRNP
ncbi:MAG: MFS transporter [Desulfatiglans sp.]|jgi:MFS family permease|nr:MFS transporter [Desulfatiglans sp.]